VGGVREEGRGRVCAGETSRESQVIECLSFNCCVQMSAKCVRCVGVWSDA